MFKIVTKKRLNEAVTLLEVDAPLIAKKAQAGQFIVFRVDEFGERIPLTIADQDRERGTVTIIFQSVGRSTKLLASLEPGDAILDFVGPLGKASPIGEYKKICVVGGGVGCAIAYPSAKAHFLSGANVDVIAGFRNREIVILEEEMRAVSHRMFLTTDDGSYGIKGFVTNQLKQLLDEGNSYDLIIAIGPVIMMKMVAEVTRPYGIHTDVSLNPIMIDGTGMCGCCRVSIDGKIRFACIDGPEFDGHKVDFDELMKRNTFYKNQEVRDDAHPCRLIAEVPENA